MRVKNIRDIDPQNNIDDRRFLSKVVDNDITKLLDTDDCEKHNTSTNVKNTGHNILGKLDKKKQRREIRMYDNTGIIMILTNSLEMLQYFLLEIIDNYKN